MKNPFAQDNDWQLNIRDRILYPFYKGKAHDGRFVFADKGSLADMLQREMAVDTIMQTGGNAITTIEEKIVRWPGYEYKNYTLEIMSCTVPGREKLGWMHYAKCDILLYCFMQADGSAVAHAIPFRKLWTWFFGNDLYLKYKSTTTEQINKTECKIVPIKHVWDNVPGCKKFTIGVPHG